jgi:phosphoribosylaminoimidazolecarboxamide formyltransferase/IMP cyclohydrolase
VAKRRALISATDKTGVAAFGEGLAKLGFEILSTGGTAQTLREAGVSVADVASVTQFPEMLEGRIKTLHPMIHGGLLGDVRKPQHVEAMARAGIEPIEVLAVNLYAFEKTVLGEHTFDQAVEAIDIGGPAMIRAAAKNHANVLVVCDPGDYGRVLEALEGGEVEALKVELAAKAFAHTAFYDSLIARYMAGVAGLGPFTPTLTLGMRHDGAALRYGENPHQSAARYLDPLAPYAFRPFASGGKEISYNNWLDADAAWDLVCDLPQGACAIIKHGNPCGAAVGESLAESYRLARESDPISAFGGIVAFNAPLDQGAVEAMTEKGNFLEVVIAAEGSDESLVQLFRERSAWAANVRFLAGLAAPRTSDPVVRSVRGGFLVQQNDVDPGDGGWRVATAREPSEEQWKAMRLLWRIVPHVKSNAIVVGTGERLLGTGAGQMNRVQSVRLALEQAGELAKGATLASDAFFPFPDSIETAAAAGIAAVIQPGGSKKDPEVVEAADRLGLAMVMTGTRHFRH